MSAAIPLHIIDDDDGDEFDWEAAVREIDVACENSKLSVSTPPPNASNDFSSLHQNNKNIPFNGFKRKQSTLDRFIGNRTVENRNQHRGYGVVVGCEEEAGTSCVLIDDEAAKTWIYPVNIPLRDYQLAITKMALFSNTLVALPTGLGKTLIAAVVMYNYFRWFPDGKIVFTAPSRPLVVQQIEACHNIVGIPQEWTIDMTGQINPTTRADFWKAKRVFFVTPQVLEKDIQAGTCLVQQLVCLVIDEAHRASGNYSYCVAVRELMAVPVQLRILALTATPGSKQQAIQSIIDNLRISTLEYRDESDPDVSPYVHNRKIELIEVALGKDAVDINKCLVDVIRPYVTRLSAVGLLPSRDYLTLSPPDLLNSRDKFRRAPPQDLPHSRYGEIEAYFGGLITLYHIRKLLSSHGIRPAFEMLEEKLKQGSFARLMSKNEDIRKVKLLMQKSLSNGAPSPKLSKMLEVLVDHFKTKDPQNSRVIIFSNFRGSVRDIMNALANIGDLVKATEFIGQSSGKALKGQSQKVQQAVLQKFRAGGYNVIVATSIGEEGLDIMEVDLVICFDANISPLRMIQRMGRTGRKHDGRVVVLACEGSELKGYMRKQASSRSIRKHMHNGGIHCFNFHSSPRMIPHIFKPEVQFVEMSIEQYVPRGKVKGSNAIQIPTFKDKLTVTETALVAKYFQPTNKNAWKPSIIAFPRFQALPSKVHKVMHSYRTDMLIDMMQQLQGVSFSGDSRSFCIENEVSLGKCSGIDATEMEENDEEGKLICDDSPSAKLQEKVTESEASPMKPLGTKKHNVFHFCSPPVHSYFFGSDFVSIDELSNVLVLSIPSLPFNAISLNCSSPKMTDSLYHSKQKCSFIKSTIGDLEEPTMQGKPSPGTTTSLTQHQTNVALPISRLCNPSAGQKKMLDQLETIPETPILDKNLSNEGVCVSEAYHPFGNTTPSVQFDAFSHNFEDNELSPRLTNMIQNGIVPESPFNDNGLSSSKGMNHFLVEEPVSPVKLCTKVPSKAPSPMNTRADMDDNSYQKDLYDSPINSKIQNPSCEWSNTSRTGGHTSTSPVVGENNTSNTSRTGGHTSTSPVVGENTTPFANINSCTNEWHLSSVEKSNSVYQVRKFKRLRKVGDIAEIRNSEGKNGNCVPIANLDLSFCSLSPMQRKRGEGKSKRAGNARDFIEEEAEVSSDAEVSEDEEDGQDHCSYENSFIDDRITPTASSTQSEGGRVDMMAVYRRSLLSQSSMGIEPSFSAMLSADCRAASRRNESGSSSEKTRFSVHTPLTNSINHSNGADSGLLEMNTRGVSAATPLDSETQLEKRKRKLSFVQSESNPTINLEHQAPKESFKPCMVEKLDSCGDVYDDQFFASLDLDAVEKQAASLLKNRSEVPTDKHFMLPELDFDLQTFDIHISPSFDLGI